MKLEATVVGERFNTFRLRTGVERTERIVMLQDRDEKRTFINTVDFVLGEDESKKYSKEVLRGQTVIVHFDAMRVDFGGRVKLSGELVPLNGAMTKPAPK